MRKSKIRSEDTRDMTVGRKSFKRNMIDELKKSESDTILNTTKPLSWDIKDIEDAWDNMD